MKVVNICCQGIFIGMRLSELILRDIISTLLHSNGARFWQKIPIRHVVL